MWPKALTGTERTGLNHRIVRASIKAMLLAEMIAEVKAKIAAEKASMN